MLSFKFRFLASLRATYGKIFKYFFKFDASAYNTRKTTLVLMKIPNLKNKARRASSSYR